MHPLIESNLAGLAEAIIAAMPRRAPGQKALANAKLVAHRGQRDGWRVRENTFAAFDPVIAAGVPAIEFDVRFTRDHEPVVVHDSDLQRVFGRPDRIAETRWSTLQRIVPDLPHLEAFLTRYAERAHLMIELKTRGSSIAEASLAALLRPLRPVVDFHILSLRPALFALLDELPSSCRIPVAKLNLAEQLRWTLNHPCGGLAGPQMLMRANQIRRLHAERGFVGSGFVSRTGALWREIGRGVEWIFSNDPVPLQRALDRARGTG
ncbi:MAG: glycerophosphodiester phosphodiesterase [Salinisphaera sp.]|nr:glycerophosphodiester phosphodiesterase [Salinisphaera sp.]